MPEDGVASAGGFEAPEPTELTALLDGFEVHHLIACGGMGAVYSAEQLSLGREVAIKVLPRELAHDETFRDSFEAEARAMAKLTHPNLIGVYDFGQIEGMLYLVMEFVEGDSLFAVSHDQIVDPQQAVDIVRGIASGLGHAHEHGIVHRDIKPANILIGPDLIPKLGDFGLAVASDDVASGMVMGTPGFVAPEVLNDAHAASPASDVFALGALLHQLLTGITPDWDAPPDIDLVPNIGALRHLVRKAVSIDPTMRFNDGTEMAKGLGEWLEKAKKGALPLQVAEVLPATAFGNVSAPPVATSSGGGFGMLSLVGLIVVALIGGGVWFAMNKSDDPPTVAVSPSPTGDPDPDGNPGPDPAPPPKMDENPGGDTAEPPSPPEPVLDPEEIKAKYIAALRNARDEVITKRRANRQALEESIHHRDKWTGYLALIDSETQLIPRRLPKDTGLRFDGPMIQGIDQFVFGKQQRINDEHYAAVERLHRDCLQELDEADAAPKGDTRRYWEEWAEWLGLSPLHILAGNLAGEWNQENGGPRQATLHIDPQGGVTVALGGVEFSGGTVTISPRGEIVVTRSPEDSTMKWTLRWRDETMVGENEGGESCEFYRKDPGLAAFRNAGSSRGPKPPGGEPGPDEPQGPVFTDPELAALSGKYLAAVHKQIGPLATGYRKVLATALKLAEKRDNARSIEQLSAEILRLDELEWKSGRVDLDSINWDTVIPLSQQSKKSKFDRTFREKMGKLQTTYVSQLKMLLTQHRVKKMNVDELQQEIERFELPAGTVKARYVKLQAEQAEQVFHSVINELNVLDPDGEPLPQESMSIHGVSSHQEARGGNPARSADHVLDGKPGTFWHSRWAPQREPWPHWIAIDLGKESIISGFRALPRQDDLRGGDIKEWTFFISSDGKQWRQVAEGSFPKSRQEQEFRFSR